MRWSIVGLIFRRELLDQVRDRRTLFMIIGLPVLLYPLAGMGLMQLAAGFGQRDHTVAIVQAEQLPAPTDAVRTAVGLVGLAGQGPLAVAPLLPAAHWGWPALLAPTDSPPYRLLGHSDDAREAARTLHLQPVASLEAARELLDSRQIDLILVVDEDFLGRLDGGRQPILTLFSRIGEDRSRLAETKMTRVLAAYRQALKETRLFRAGLPTDFDTVFLITNPERPAFLASVSNNGSFFAALAQVFPFVLVMWSLAGALYPAVDLCAGEKERGTMETLLISPASREEIVWGKFLTIWLFSAATALLNLLSMAITTWYFTLDLPVNPLQPSLLLWGSLLLLPLSAFFSAVSLAIGVYARSSKEGQYYLMPLFFVTMPLVFLTLVPGVELNAFYSMVPVTGVALLLKELMAASKPSLEMATYFLPVLAPMIIYSWLALRWAIEQFQREEVLFREAERLEVGLWFRNLFREKEALPGAGMAFFCAATVLLLFQITQRLPLRTDVQMHTTIAYLAFVLTPTLMMAVLLTRRPLPGLSLRPCAPTDLLLGLALAVLLFLPGVLTYVAILTNIPGLKDTLLERVGPSTPVGSASDPVGWLAWLQLALLLMVLMAICEELTFRGFILTGLSRHFSPVVALFLSSFLYALFHMNVFQAVPHFLLGLVLGLLTQRTGSVFPAIVLHAAFNALVGLGLGLGPIYAPDVFAWFVTDSGTPTLLGYLAAGTSLLGALALVRLLLARPVQVPPPAA